MQTRRTFLVQSAGLAAAATSLNARSADKARATDIQVSDSQGALQPVDLKRVALAGEFGRRVDRIIDANILKIDIDETFLVDFRKRGKGGFVGLGRYVGLGKFVDAVVRLAAATDDERLRALREKLLVGLLATQDPDGYIGTVADPQARLKALWDLHEVAYLIWALVSDYALFGDISSRDAAQRMADYVLIRLTANPVLLEDTEDENKPPRPIPFLLPSVGLDRALLALSRVTKLDKYRDFVVDTLKLEEYDPPIRTGDSSLRNHGYGYLAHCLAQLDLYREGGNQRLLRATQRALEFMRRGDGLLVTGSCTDHECWHDTQSGLHYTSETCMGAYIARVMDAMLQVEGDSLYGDIMERDIYNALFAATAPDGSQSRYFTPFDGRRYYDTDWHGYRYCCANNNKRFLADLRSWMYYHTASGVAVNLYNASTATLSVAQDVSLRIEQQTNYPTSGDVLIKVDPSRTARFEVKLRIPRWCTTAEVSVNGSTAEAVSSGQFFALERSWKAGDVIKLKMPMPWRFIRGRQSQAGRAAVLRGPVIFTLNPERNLHWSAQPDFEPRLMVIDPRTVKPPAPDDAVRPGGLSCVIQAELPGSRPSDVRPGALLLSEYPDPNGRGIYFIVRSRDSSMLTDDELIR